MNNYSNDLRNLASYSGFKPLISKVLLDAADELDKYTTEGKWYIRCNSAEEDSYAVVQLNESEYAAVIKFTSADEVIGGGYCGTCHIINHGFNTKEEALEAIATNTVWLYGE